MRAPFGWFFPVISEPIQRLSRDLSWLLARLLSLPHSSLAILPLPGTVSLDFSYIWPPVPAYLLYTIVSVNTMLGSSSERTPGTESHSWPCKLHKNKVQGTPGKGLISAGPAISHHLAQAGAVRPLRFEGQETVGLFTQLLYSCVFFF